MMISRPMYESSNEQIGNELAASHQCMAIAVYLDSKGFPALAKHFSKQAAEGRTHALRFVNESRNELEWFISERREEVSSMGMLLRILKHTGEAGLFYVETSLLQGGLHKALGEGESEGA